MVSAIISQKVQCSEIQTLLTMYILEEEVRNSTKQYFTKTDVE